MRIISLQTYEPLLQHCFMPVHVYAYWLASHQVLGVPFFNFIYKCLALHCVSLAPKCLNCNQNSIFVFIIIVCVVVASFFITLIYSRDFRTPHIHLFRLSVCLSSQSSIFELSFVFVLMLLLNVTATNVVVVVVTILCLMFWAFISISIRLHLVF